MPDAQNVTRVGWHVLELDGGPYAFVRSVRIEPGDGRGFSFDAKDFTDGVGNDAGVEAPRASWAANDRQLVIALDRDVHFTGGGGTTRLRCDGKCTEPFGAVVENRDVARLRGQRVRLDAAVRTDGSVEHAGLLLRASAKNSVVGSVHTRWTDLSGTRDWERLSLTLDVPDDADEVAVGAIVQGRGALWVDDVSLVNVGAATKLPHPNVFALAALATTCALAIVLVATRRHACRLLLSSAPLVALGGSAIALATPVGWIDTLRMVLVGAPPDGSGTSFAQRAMAVFGAALGGLVIANLARAEVHEPRPTRRRWLVLGAIPLALFAARNVWGALAALAIVRSAPASLPYSALLYGLWSASAIPALVAHVRVTDSRQIHSALAHGGAAGAAYGLFSSLWHCCDPLWTATEPMMVLWQIGMFVLWPLCVLGFIAALALRLPARWSMLLGGALLAAVYGWHTPVWAAHCFVGGAFVVWLSRRTGSVLAPGAFLAAAYAVHMSLPFLGWIGAILGLAILAVYAARTWLRSGDPAAPIFSPSSSSSA